LDHFRRVAEPSASPGIVTVCILPDDQNGAVATVLVPGDKASSTRLPVPAALAEGKTALAKNGLAEVVVWLARDGLWQDDWGILESPGGAAMTEEEAYRFAAASNAEDDA
jgi:hypothetical protein